MRQADIQRLVDEQNALAQMERSTTGMTLGSIVDAIDLAIVRETLHGVATIDHPSAIKAQLPSGKRVGLGYPNSYRGFYCDLAFEPWTPEDEGAPISYLHFALLVRGAIGWWFTGYKGGDYLMGRDTPVWISPHNDASQARVVGIRMEHGGDSPRRAMVLMCEEHA